MLTCSPVQAVLIATVLEGDYSSTFSDGGGNGRTQYCTSSSSSSLTLPSPSTQRTDSPHPLVDLVVVLIFVAIMSLIRFVGSTAYVIDRCVRIVGSYIQRRLFARRTARQGVLNTNVRRRMALSEAGTEIKIEKVQEVGEGEDEDEAVSAYLGVGGREARRSWYGRG